MTWTYSHNICAGSEKARLAEENVKADANATHDQRNAAKKADPPLEQPFEKAHIWIHVSADAGVDTGLNMFVSRQIGYFHPMIMHAFVGNSCYALCRNTDNCES